jgi:spermidine/putrescine transport system substrate-binding protein
MAGVAGPPTSRREFLRRTALAAGGLAAGATGLAACAGKTGPNRAGPIAPVTSTPHSPGQVAEARTDATTDGTVARQTAQRESIDNPEAPGGLLRIANRPGSIAPDTVRDYQLATGVTVDYYEEIADDQTWLTSIDAAWRRHDDIGSDLVILGDDAVNSLVSSGRLASLDQTNIPNRGHLRRELATPGYDPKRHRSLPWVAGMAGLAYNPALTGRPITAVADLFDPTFKGRVTMLADLRDGLGMVMLSQGNSPAHAEPATVAAAVETVSQARLSGQVARFTGNADFADLASGAVALAQVRSGDVAGLRAANPALVFVVPEAGSTLFARNMVVPDTTHNQVAAESWMNWIYDRSNYAQLIAAVRGTVALTAMTTELDRLSPALAADPLINPPAAIWAKLVVWAGLDARTEARYDALYRQATG